MYFIIDPNRRGRDKISGLGLAEPDFTPVEKQEPTLFDEAGTKKQVMSNIV